MGYLDAEVGIGEAARQLIAALDERRVPVAPIGRSLPSSRRRHPFVYTDAPRPGPFAVNLVCENAIGVAPFAESVGRRFFEDRYSVGLWFWEVSRFPDAWDSAFEHLEEVWVASEHVAGAVGARSPVPVTKVRLPVRPVGVAAGDRRALGLPEGFCFLLVFDHNSVLERKNPLGLIEAFSLAFPPGAGASLALKSINAEQVPAERERVRVAAEQHPDVHLIEGFASPEEKNAMIAACDCYVSLHRSEGFGLTLAEAMYFGKPVIATGYSGNLEFMTEENSYLVVYELGPIGQGAEPYPPEGEWAEPDLEHAARLMRGVFEQPEEAAERGRRGAEHIRSTRSPAAAGEAIASELDRIRDLPRRSYSDAGRVPLGDRPHNLTRARERLAAGPRPGATPGAIRALLRRVVLRLIQPYTVHQQMLDHELAEALEELAVRTERALEGIERRSQTDWAAALAGLRRLERRLDSRSCSGHRGVDDAADQ